MPDSARWASLSSRSRAVKSWVRGLAVRGSRAWWLPKILNTRAIACVPDGLEVHMITCRRDVLESLWAAKTFAYFSGQALNLFFHDDGTLTAADEKTFLDHFPGCTVLRRERTDREMAQFLSGKTRSAHFRAAGHWTSLKMFDPHFYAQQSSFLLLDSDVLFFSSPTEVVDLLSADEYFFLDDYQSAYVFSKEEIKEKFEIEIIPRLNAGLIRLSKSMLNWSLIEEYLASVGQVRCKNWIEQTLVAMLVSSSGLNYRRLPSSYQMMWEPITEGTRCHHFCGLSRGNYWFKGLRMLNRWGALRQLNGR